MRFLESYGENSITFEWNSYGGGGFEDIEWDYGWSDLGRKKLPTSMNNLVIEIVSEHAEPMFEDIYSETDAYQLRAKFYPKEKIVELRVAVEEYTSEENYTEEKILPDSPIMQFIKKNDIKLISCAYDGGGDSGEITYMTVDGNDESIYRWERDDEKKIVVETLYEFLENNYGGWEIDDGSSGTIQLSDNGFLSISHSWNSRDWYDTGHLVKITSEDFN